MSYLLGSRAKLWPVFSIFSSVSVCALFFVTKVLVYVYFTRIVLVLFAAMLPFEVRGYPVPSTHMRPSAARTHAQDILFVFFAKLRGNTRPDRPVRITLVGDSV